MTLQNQDTADPNLNTSPWLDRFGLETDPFEEPLHFLVDADEAVVTSIINVLADAEQPVLLVARRDSDRRRMLDKVLLRTLPAMTCRISASLMMSEWELLGHLAGTLQLSTAGKKQADLEHELASLLNERPADINDLLCVIEDAQLMSETLITYALQFAKSYRLKLVLVAANPEIFAGLDDQELYRWQIPDFSPALTMQYLDKRFRLAGSSLPEVFDNRIVAWICQESEGDPHLIDQAAMQVLQHTNFVKAPLTQVDYLKWTLLFSVVLLLFPGVYLLNGTILSGNQIIPDSVGSTTLIAAPAKMAPGLPFKVTAADEPLMQVREDSKPEITPESAVETVVKTAPLLQAPQQINYARNMQLPDHLTPGWLKRVNPEFYTVQVIGSHSREKIDNFLGSVKSRQGYAWFESTYNAQPWYVVIKGIYPDREAAVAEAARVRKITGLEPWVRSFEKISEVR